MRLVEDEGLSFCLTVSTGVKRDELLSILGVVEGSLTLRAFSDSASRADQAGRTGLLNVFETGDALVTLENGGLLGATRRTIRKVSSLQGEVHYVAVHYSSAHAACQYVEVKDGVVLANFDPRTDDAPEPLVDFFWSGDSVAATRHGMIRAAECRIEVVIDQEWLDQDTDTYLIDYRIDRH